MGLATGSKITESGHVPMSIRKAFVPSIELENIAGFKVALWSRAKVGKTHLAFTCPKPIYGFDTEGAWAINKDQFDIETQKHTHVAQVLYMADKAKGKVDLIKSLDAVMDRLDILTDYIICNDKVDAFLEIKKTTTIPEIMIGITDDTFTPILDTVEYVLEEMVEYGSTTKVGDTYTFVRTFPRGTIVIDSGTDIWDWLGMWKDTMNFKEPGRLQWGHANKRYADFIIMLLHSKWNVLGTFKAEAMVDAKGGDLGQDKAKWQKKTDYWFDVIIELRKIGNNRLAIFVGDRYGGNLGTLDNPTWDTIKTLLESKKKVKVN